MTKKQRVIHAIEMLEKIYPEAQCSLIYSSPHELLIATRLSAQCTDARVNIVTEPLFKKYKTVEEFSKARIEDVQEIIKSCGLYKTKGKDTVLMCKMLMEEYNGQIPDSIEELIKLPGIGRKTANLVVGDIFGKPSIVVDTHCIRICNRLGIVTGKDPLKIEMDLRKIVPPEKGCDFCHRLVLFGREYCKAQNPKCLECQLQEICKFYKIKN